MNLKKNFCKRLLSVLLLLAMCITSLIACNVSSNDKDTTDDDKTSNETTTEEVTTELDGGTLEDTKPVLIPDPEKETPPENPEKSLFDYSLQKNSNGALGCSKITLLAEYNVGLDFDIYAVKNVSKKTYFLQLPCRVDPTCVTYSVTHRDGSVSGPYTVNLADEEITDNERVVGTTNNYVIKMIQSDLPTVMVQVDESYVTVSQMQKDPDHKTFAYGEMVTTVPDTLAMQNGWATRYTSEDVDPDKHCSLDIRGRGNTTWKRDKKPYQIRTENDVDLLGMGYATTFAMMANDQDACGIRFPLALDLAEELGIEYTSQHRQVDFFLNGKYLGMYSIVEKVEVAPNRVDIDTENDILFEVDQYYADSGEFGISLTQYDSQCRFRIHSPTEPGTSGYSKAILTRAIDALFSGVEEDFLKYFDVDSWAKLYLLEQYSMNNDAYHGSLYFYYNSDDDKMHACAPWDFDWAFGGSHREDPINWDPYLCDMAHRGISGPMFQYKPFVKRVLELYYDEGARDLFAGVPDRVEEYRKKHDLGFKMNETGVNVWYYPSTGRNNFPNTYTGLVDHLKKVCIDRLEWMDGKMKDLYELYQKL